MLLKDGVRAHPKVLRAGAEAAWLWACCIDYSRSQLTDGFVPAEALPTLASTKSRVGVVVRRLIDVGLLHAEEGGVRVHDYLDHNDSADDVREAKRRDADRKRRHGGIPDSTRTPDGVHADSKAPLARARGVGVGVGSDLHGEGTGEGARARTPPPIIDRRGHKAHALCGRVCLPSFLFDEFVRLRGGPEDEARAYVETWYDRVVAALPETATVGDEVKWLRAQWSASHPALGPRPINRAPPGTSTPWCDHDPPCHHQQEHTRRLLEEARLAAHGAPA